MTETIVGVDLGTLCGLAWYETKDGVGRWGSQTVDVATPEGAHLGERFMRAGIAFATVLDDRRPRVVFYEHVFRHMGTQAAHVFGGLLAMLAVECVTRGIPLVPVGVQRVKIAATGKGNAKKEEVVAAGRSRWGGESLDHNEADARFVVIAGLRDIYAPTPKALKK